MATTRPASSTSPLNARSVPPARVVLKFGTNLLTGGRDALDEAVIAGLAAQVVAVRERGSQVLVVTSGAVAAGRAALAMTPHPERLRPRTVAYRQALAALGQGQLMATYARIFGRHSVQVAQALLSRGDLQDRLGYLNVRNTLEALLEAGAIPIINENDVVAVEELEGEVYGDNDRLSAMVANVVDADLLVLLGEMDGLYTADPNVTPGATLIEQVDEITPEVVAAAGESRDGRGRGGMASKLEAARLAVASGAEVVIASGKAESVIERLCAGERIGTRFATRVSHVESRKRWMMTGFSESHGSVAVDRGAVRAIGERGNSLLPAGIVDVRGSFERGDIIGVLGPEGQVIAWGLANYRSADVVKIKGRQSGEIAALIGYEYGPEVVHRNNMVLT